MEDSPNSKTKSKDMYWFAHGGEPLSDKSHQQRGEGDEEVGSPEQNNSPSWKPLQDRKALPEEARSTFAGKESAVNVLDGVDNSPPLSHVERDGRAVAPAPYSNDARMSGSMTRASKNVEDEKSKKSSDAEQDKNDARAKKKVEREAALEARRNAQRSNVSFAFGSSLPRNLDLDVTTVYQGSDLDRNKRRTTQAPVSSQKTGAVTNAPRTKTDDKMSQSMISPMSACRGRRKTDLTPTIPYERTAPPRTPVPPAASSGKRSVSMTRLDQLARPRRSYIEAQRDHAKANSTSSTSSAQKDIQNSPSRPRSSASEHSAGSNRPSTTPPVNMRARATARKPRPVSIAGNLPDRKPTMEFKRDFGGHRTPEKKSEVPSTKKASTASKAKSPAPKNIYVDKPGQKSPIKHLTPKASPVRKLPSKAKKSATAAPSAVAMEPLDLPAEETKMSSSPPESPTADEENGSSIPEPGGKRIISEEEARAALAEKRRLAREQAEKEAELERLHQEELRRQEEERIREEEEEQRRMEEEQLRLLEEHRKHEEEKLRKAIEEQEKKEQEEKLKKEEEARLKAEQERKAKEEAERQRIELEEKLRKEEEERAERKKRLEKIMSRTRGKGTSSMSSHSGDQSDSADSQIEAAEALSGNSSLNSIQSTDPSSGSASLEIHPESIQGSENESLNSIDMMALSDNSSLDSNLLMLPSEGAVSLDSDQASTLSNQNVVFSETVTDNTRNHSPGHISSEDIPVEQNASSASDDKSSSHSSENEKTAKSSAICTEDKVTCDQPALTSETITNVDSTSDNILDFGTDFVQTLVSQGEKSNSGDVSVSDHLESFATDTTSHDIFNKSPPVDSEHLAAEVKQGIDAESKVNAPSITSQDNVVASNFTVPCEAFGLEVGYSEVQDGDINIVNSENYECTSPTEKEANDNSSDNLSTTPQESTEKILNEENVIPSLQPPNKNINIVAQGAIISSSKIFDGNSEQYFENTDVSQSVGLPSKIFDGNSEQYFENTSAPQSVGLPSKIFDGNLEQCVESTDSSQSVGLPSKIFDGNSEEYVESTDASQSIGLPSKIFDGNSEQYFENADAPQSVGLPSKIFDGNLEQCVESTDSSQSTDFPNKNFDGNSGQCVESTDVSQSIISSNEIFDGNSEQYVKSTDASQSIVSASKIFDGNSEQYVKSTDASQPVGLPSKVFDGNSEEYIKSTDALQPDDLSSKIFDESSEQYVESINQPVGLQGKVFDGISEDFVESTVISRSFGSPAKIFDEDSKQYVEHDMLQSPKFADGVLEGDSEQYLKSVDAASSPDFASNPFTESKSAASIGDGSAIPKEGANLFNMGECGGVISSVEDLEPSAIQSVRGRVNLPDEFFTSSITDSEDSSLDSNLSQIMNVNTTHNASSEEIDALDGSPLDIANKLSGKISALDASSIPFQKMPHYISSDNNAPTTNGYQSHVMGCAYGNGIDDCKTSNLMEGHHPVSSLTENEINSNIISPINNHVENILNEDINFNKVPSNPFLASADTSELSENQFLNQEEVMRNPFQTESHA